MRSSPLVSEAQQAAERGVIGASLNQPGCVLELELEPRHFNDLRWQRTWETVLQMLDEGEQIDETTVARRLELEGVNGMLADLCSAALQPAIVPGKYADIIREAWLTRQVVFAAAKVLEAQEAGLSGEELLSLALENLASVSVGQPDQAESIRSLVTARLRKLGEMADARAKGQVAVTGVPTGIAGLDELLGGLQRGICTVVAGRPGMGKSAFGMACTAHAAALGLGVHVFSFEDTRDAYTDRVLSRESGIAAERMRAGDLRSGDLTSIVGAVDRVRSLRGWLVDDRSGLQAEEVVRSVRRSLAKNATQLVIVDYAQLVHGPRNQKRCDQLTHVMGVLADAAKRDNLAYLVLAQLNRDCEKRDNKRPQLSDLKESGALEERAKAVLMLYRPALYRELDPQTRQPFPESRMEILVRKNNHGRTGKVLATWTGATTRIDS